MPHIVAIVGCQDRLVDNFDARRVSALPGSYSRLRQALAMPVQHVRSELAAVAGADIIGGRAWLGVSSFRAGAWLGSGAQAAGGIDTPS